MTGVERHKRMVRRMKRRAIALIGKVCAICGTTSKLEFAHLMPTGLNGEGRGQYWRYRDVLEFPECYARLCEGCHARFDGSFSEGSGIED